MSGCAPLIDVALGDLLDAVADRLAERIAPQLAAPGDRLTDRWLTTREAAQHLGMHPDNLRKLAAAREIPSEQDAPGCVHHFRLSDLDRWRESGGPRRQGIARGASTRLPRIGKAA
jgi:excisionase family DNA binding protein